MEIIDELRAYVTLTLIDSLDSVISDLTPQAYAKGKKRDAKKLQEISYRNIRSMGRALDSYQGLQDLFGDFADSQNATIAEELEKHKMTIWANIKTVAIAAQYTIDAFRKGRTNVYDQPLRKIVHLCNNHLPESFGLPRALGISIGEGIVETVNSYKLKNP